MSTKSKFNPFATLGCESTPLFSTYVRWDGTSDPYIGSTEGLKTACTYRVVEANIGSSCSYLYLQEVSSGKKLNMSYNSVYFTPLPSGIGYANKLPTIGKRFEIRKIENEKTIDWSTSIVQGFEQVSLNVWNVITCNTVYTVFIE